MRIARELRDGEVVNVGHGLVVNLPDFLPPNRHVICHSENGVVGYGRLLGDDDPKELMDVDLVGAGTNFLERLPGMCVMDVAEAIACVRTGRVTTTVLGAFEVSEKGDLANWSTDPRGAWGSIGGAMDMPVGAKRVIVGMEHVDKRGRPKIVRECRLPLTAPRCVDLIVTDIAVVEVTAEGLELKEVAPGWTAKEVQELTEPRLIARNVKEMEL